MEKTVDEGGLHGSRSEYEADCTLIGLRVERTTAAGDEVKIHLCPRSRRAFPQRSAWIRFDGVTAVHAYLDPPLVGWQPLGELGSLSFANGVAALTLLTYGPGNVWSDNAFVDCRAMQSGTRLLVGPSLRAAVLWLLSQWWFWIGAVLLLVTTLARLAGWSSR